MAGNSAEGLDPPMFTETDRLFFRQWLRNPLKIGALAPSSRELAESMARLVPMPARQSESGAKMMVPKLVIRSPAMCAARASAVMP